MPGRWSIPARTLVSVPQSKKIGRLTFVKGLPDPLLHAAGLGLGNVLVLHVLALGSEAVGGIHTLLELIALPAKDVIGVLTVASVVTVAEVERLRA